MNELDKAYEAKKLEPKWLAFWENKFIADPLSPKPSYCIVIPPPNITGVLHMGHALVNTLQDVLIRWKRMQGFEVLWVPGTDHAGIATQTVVEKKLIKEKGKKRVDFGRNEFLSHVWEWKEANEFQILSQLKRLGSSCDWSRTRFTMDEKNNRAVNVMFKKLYDDKLIYQGDYLVNWDTATQTALADDEVEYEERDGFIYTLKYPIEGSDQFIQVATTRPETMLGDTAVAVSIKDERYKSFIGKNVLHPITNRKIPIIADPFVDPAFGTGAVKITPAHDPNDYEMGIRHNLAFINMMTKEGKINEVGKNFEGLTMLEGREAILQEMKTRGLLAKIEPHKNRVGVSYRSKAVIEPFISKQWFIKMEPFKGPLRQCITEGKTRLIPKQWENTYFHWIDNLRDWCISRQLWWGHRIPIYYKKGDRSVMICEIDKDPGEDWEQDPDVLDTWFSSALWPFAALGWPEKTSELKRFYPNSVLVTGHDILFFWVARMLMMGQYEMKETPFPDVFLHGLIFGKSYWRNTDHGAVYLSEKERIEYDKGKAIPKDVQFRWEKMSKSKGNVIDPLEIIEEFGTDALRMTMCSSGTQSREIDLDRRKFEDFKNFANKVWNGARFVFMQVEDLNYDSAIDKALLTLEDKWILSLLNQTIQKVNDSLSRYEFDKAAMTAYDFFWKEFCAYYVEIVKPTLFGKRGIPEERKNKQKILTVVLCASIRLIHPMAPFITEELFANLKARFGEVKGTDPYTLDLRKSLDCISCAFAPYPQIIDPSDIQPAVEKSFSDLDRVVYTLRNIRGEMKLPPNASPAIYLNGKSGDTLLKLIEENQHLITSLVKTEGLHIGAKSDSPFAATGVVDSIEISIPLPKELLEQEKGRLKKEEERLRLQLEKMQQQMANPDFTSRAPKELIEKNEGIISKTKSELTAIAHKLTQL